MNHLSLKLVNVNSNRFKSDKKLVNYLVKFYGVGFFRVKYILSLFGLPLNVYTKSVDSGLLNEIRLYIFDNFYVKKELNFIEKKRFKRIFSVKNYRSYRHLHRLPVRGQRTHSNAKTQRKLGGRYR